MYTSVTDTTGMAIRTAFAYLVISLVCVLFGVVYEIHSHEVYSFYMIYAFVFPLAGGTLPFLLFSLFQFAYFPRKTARQFYHSGMAALTTGSLVQGVLDIYGTTNALVDYYWIGGGVLTLCGVAGFLWPNIRKYKR